MSLLELQRDFRDWLAEASEAAAERLGEPARAGLAVYQNNYRASLLACLSDTFERVRLWLGDDRFLTIAAAHIDVTPPHGWTLDAYAQGFPETLRLLFVDEPVVAELGWLDLALSEAFVAPDADPVNPQSLGTIDWDNAVLRLSPTLATTPFATNAGAIWSALAAGGLRPSSEPLAQPVTMIVWRKDLVSCFRTAAPGEAKAVELARCGDSFGRICAGLIEELGEERGIGAAGTILGRWISDGLIVDLA